MTKCDHNKWIEYHWKLDKNGHDTDQLVSKTCYICGVELKVGY